MFIMFKNILPHDARVSRRIPSKMDNHLQGSAYAPLAVAMHSSAIRIKNSLKRLTRKRLS